jgi:hypothetical protein
MRQRGNERAGELLGGGTTPACTGGRMAANGYGGVPVMRGVLGGCWRHRRRKGKAHDSAHWKM